jgi:hypothetical protein
LILKIKNFKNIFLIKKYFLKIPYYALPKEYNNDLKGQYFVRARKIIDSIDPTEIKLNIN